jgi:integrase
MTKAIINTTLVKNTREGDREIWISDTKIRGFGLRVRPGRDKAYVFRYQAEGKRRLKVLGACNVITAAQARKKALKLAGQVADDLDPVKEQKAQEAMVTLADFCDAYLIDAYAGKVTYRKRPKKASTLAVDKGRIERHIKPIIGDIKLPDITGKEVARLYEAVLTGETAKEVKTGPRGKAVVTGGPTAANRVIGLLGGILSYARKKHLIDANPVHGFEKHADNERERVLTPKELEAVGQKTRDMEAGEKSTPAQKSTAKIIRALLLTGCRLSEISALKKSELDQNGSCIRYEDTKSGRQIRPLGQSAIAELLKAPGFKDDDADYLYPATRGEGPIAGIGKIWREIRDGLGLKDVSPHVFRHTFATIAHEDLDYSERTVDGLLGHAFKKGKYIHKADRALVMAADRVSAEIARRIGDEVSDNVIQLKA